MHPKSPRQDVPIPWLENVMVCMSSKYSRFALFVLGTIYIVFSLTGVPHQRITVRDPEVKRLMKREDEVTMSAATVEHDDVMSSSAEFTSYLPSLHPVLKLKNAHKDHPINIRFLMGTQENSQSEFLVEGIERSGYLKLVSLSRYDKGEIRTWNTNKVDSKHATVWIADVESMDLDCHVLEGLVQHIQYDNKQELPTALVLVDYSGSSERVHCPRLEELIPRDYIRMTRHNIIKNRHWNSAESWVDMGELALNDGNLVSGGTILFSPHFVRDSLVWELSLALKKANHTNAHSLVDLYRERDVAHFWRRDDYSHYTFLRAKVSEIVESLTGEHSNGREIHTVVNVFGEVENMEMNVIDIDYVEKMIGTKIIVVAQRDEWEGHRRSLEALASGAMVIADKALGMPTGLIDRESIVLYDSAQSLKDSILYYLNPRNNKERLSIARKGWETAMGRHRSWHRVEEIIFGQPLSQVDRPFDPAPPKRRRRIIKVKQQDKAVF